MRSRADIGHPKSSVRLLGVAVAGTLAMLIGACAAEPTPASTTAGPSPVDAAPRSAGASPAPSTGPSASGDFTAGGLSLADADLELLLDAFSGYGFEMEAEPDETGTGGNLWTGSLHDGEVEVVVIESGGAIEQVGVFDYSGGEVGLDELGFLIGIFAPEAQSWLVDQATQAVENPGTEIRARQEFGLVTLEFNAFVDETQSLDLWVEAPEGAS